MSDPELVALPVGFERFHRRDFINYQLNRAYALGFADRHELVDAAAHVRSMDDCVTVFEALSGRAAAEARPRQAAGYERIAEFFTPPRSVEKTNRYRRYLKLFDTAFADAAIVRHEIPYADAALPAYSLPAAGTPTGDTVLLHGGFDSLIEEFFPICQRIAAAGFDVIAFEGPGQGGARALNGLTFDHDWEKPVGAVLDHFHLDRAALVGISMGAYWALRAAGREPRIHSVVAWPPVYDWLHRVPPVFRGPVRTMVRRRRFMRWSVRTRARLSPTLRVVVNQVLYMLDSDDPADVAEWFLGMNAEHLDSGRVNQDVLLMCGEHDAFQPPALTQAQAQALVAARSVTTRMFTRAEQADQHCQMGNLELACEVLTTWLQSAGTNAGDDVPRERLCRHRRPDARRETAHRPAAAHRHASALRRIGHRGGGHSLASFSDSLGNLITVLPRAYGPAGAMHEVASAGIVLVSRLQLRSARHVPGFLLASLRLRRALRQAPGAVWLNLAAQPFTATFWTWSGWTDEDAMRRYTRSELHAHVMRTYRPHLQDSTFRSLPAAQAPATWPEVRGMLSATTPTASDG